MKLTEYSEISIIVPVLNGEKTLREFFAALYMQDIDVGEIIVGDSHSSDASVEICKENGAKVISVEKNEFDHGGTRSILGKQAKGVILVYFTQDAILAAKESLRRLVEPLRRDNSLCCAYGRQLPAPGATLLAAHLRLFNYGVKSERRVFSDRAHYGLKTVFISNSFAAYKKERLEQVGFFKNGLIFGEDTCTLGKLIKAGEAAYYASDATVYHSHNYNVIEEFKRSFDIGVLHSSETWLLDTYGNAEGVGKKYVLSALNAILTQKKYTLLIDWLLRNAAKFTGYKLGRMYQKMPKRLCAELSLNRSWWKVQ